MSQIAHQQKTRKYNDELQYYNFMPPKNTLRWLYVDQLNIIYDTEYSKRIAEEDYDIEDKKLNVIINSMEIARGGSKSGSFIQEE
ncbi:hypothetical protein RclHR1_17070007 [Rhizophagus clarus]|nr:hypothetical protein RclHR1_17070007 [Rhizophagus clarus]